MIQLLSADTYMEHVFCVQHRSFQAVPLVIVDLTLYGASELTRKSTNMSLFNEMKWNGWYTCDPLHSVVNSLSCRSLTQRHLLYIIVNGRYFAKTVIVCCWKRNFSIWIWYSGRNVLVSVSWIRMWLFAPFQKLAQALEYKVPISPSFYITVIT